VPASNAAFWRDKIASNVARDKLQVAWLNTVGWTALRVWEHDVPHAAERLVVERVHELRAQEDSV